MFDELRILYPGTIYPHGLSGGYLRTFNIAKLLINKFDKICVFANDNNYSYNKNINGIFVVQGKYYKSSLDRFKYYFDSIFLNRFSLKTQDAAFDDMKSSLFQIEGPYYFNLLIKKRIKKYILDEQNVYWELGRMPALDSKIDMYNKYIFNRNKNIEIKAIQNASHVLACSEIDKQKILNMVPEMDGLITVIPNCVNIHEYKYCKNFGGNPTESNIYLVLFIGLMSYFPNSDAVRLICTKIAPKCDNKVKFIIIGKEPPAIKKPENVDFLGYVDDVKKYIFRSDICIAPLRYGSGTRLKILEYMGTGKPVISTSKGAEGLEYTNNLNIIIEDNIDMFPERILELIEQKSKRDKVGKNARELVEQKYNWEIYREQLIRIYEGIQ